MNSFPHFRCMQRYPDWATVAGAERASPKEGNGSYARTREALGSDLRSEPMSSRSCST